MLFHSNPLLYQYQTNQNTLQETAMNALYTSKMQSMYYGNVYNANLLDSFHQIRGIPWGIGQCNYYMDVLSYLMSVSPSNSSSITFNHPYGHCNVYNITPPNSVSTTTTTATTLQREEEDKDNKEEENRNLIDAFKQFYPQKRIGSYDWKTRVMKIIRYKIKNIQKQDMKPVMTKYSGRSKVASLKARYRGRFIRTDKLKDESSRKWIR